MRGQSTDAASCRRKIPHHLVGAVGELEAVEQLLRVLAPRFRVDAKICAVEEQDFAGRKSKVEVRRCCTTPINRLTGPAPPHVMLANPRLPPLDGHVW